MKKTVVLMVVISILCITAPASASDLGLKRINGQVGILFPSTDGLDHSVGFSLGAGADLGEITKNLSLVPSLSYWIMNVDPEGGAVTGVDASASNFQIVVDVHYFFEQVQGLYAGGGLSINFTSISVDYNVPGLFTGEASDSATDVGIDLLAGYEMPLGKTTQGFAEIKYNIISDLNTLAVVLGVWFDMK
jgi:hypothetical protein